MRIALLRYIHSVRNNLAFRLLVCTPCTQWFHIIATPEQDTPLKPQAKISSRRAPKPVTNEDLMDALSSVQADLKADLAYVRAQVAELRAENSSLRSEIDILKDKLASLDTATNTQ